MNDQTTQILLVGAVIYIALQVQKRAKETDLAPSRPAPAPSGARTRTGRIADDAQRLASDSRGFVCDNFGLFCG